MWRTTRLKNKIRFFIIINIITQDSAFTRCSHRPPRLTDVSLPGRTSVARAPRVTTSVHRTILRQNGPHHPGLCRHRPAHSARIRDLSAWFGSIRLRRSGVLVIGLRLDCEQPSRQKVLCRSGEGSGSARLRLQLYGEPRLQSAPATATARSRHART